MISKSPGRIARGSLDTGEVNQHGPRVSRPLEHIGRASRGSRVQIPAGAFSS